MLFPFSQRSAGFRSIWLAVVVCLVGLSHQFARAQSENPLYLRRSDVVYGRKDGLALTLDVFTPRANGNQRGLLFCVSGGWFSAHQSINDQFFTEFLKRGYTVFAVVHGSQPKYTIPEIISDMHRAVRFVRHHAGMFGVDPNHLGIFGGSAGGHLSLMQATHGLPGQPEAADPVDRQSSSVQAAACFFPPTDFLNYGQPGENALGRGVLNNFRAPFDFRELDTKVNVFVPITDEDRVREIGRQISPVYHITPDDPPMLIVHGDADKLVPIQQAQRMVELCREAKVSCELVVKPNAAHGWPDLPKDLVLFADWFDRHLATPKTKS
ncbi:MAG: alpha/beta hydrolase fold domain-containing protein [Planctomycetaceae bacterium]